jgi:2-polyprenyl-6-methoxyphenol hydroxylase-like FAD-dependent oxidoreductase
MSKSSVVVVGGGPAGVAISLLLAERGIGVTLVEREPDFDRVFRGEGLMPSGVDALFEMGLANLLDELPTRKLESWELYIDGRLIMSIPEPLAELGDRAMRIIPQAAFLDAVVAKSKRSPSFTFMDGTAAHDLVIEGDRVAGVRVRNGAGEQVLRADLVIACDGRGSLMRTRAGFELKQLRQHFDVLWFKMPAPDSMRDRCSMFLMPSRHAMAACYTSWDGRLQFALMVPKGVKAAELDGDWPEILAGPSPNWLKPHYAAVRDEIEGPMRLNVMVGRSERWSRPGLLLLGDAAHPMSPIRAQGINLALRDAIVAANHLVPALRAGDPAAVDAAGRAIQAEREPEIIRSQTLQHRDTQNINTPIAPVLMALAKHLGGFLGRYRWAQNAWLAQQHDLRFGSREVRLTAQS